MKRRASSVNIDRQKMKKGRLYSIAVQPKPVNKYGAFLRALQTRRIDEYHELETRVVTELKKAEAEVAEGKVPEPIQSGLEVIQPPADGSKAPVNYGPEDLEELESKLEGLKESRRKMVWLLEQVKIVESEQRYRENRAS